MCTMDYPNSQNKNTNTVFMTEVDSKDYDISITGRFRILERFTKVKVPFYRVA